MQNKQQKQHNNKQQKIISFNQYNHQIFQNLICKSTFNSIPKIYGLKKKKYYINHTHHQQIQHIYQSKKKIPISSHFSVDKIHNKSVKVQIYNKYNQGNINRLIRNYTQLTSKKGNNNLLKTNITLLKKTKIVIPQKLKFQLQQLQTSHKVNNNYIFFSKTTCPSSQLQNMIINEKINRPKSIMNKTHYIQRSHNNSQITKKSKSIYQNNNNQNKLKIIQDKNQSNLTQQNQTKKLSFSSKQQDLQSSSKKSINSSPINNSMIFKKIQTKFQQLSDTQKSYIRKKNKKQMIRINQSYKIPSQTQYKQFIQNYTPYQQHFHFKSILKSPNFRIIKQDKQVYFGEINQSQEKHGKGITISQQQIFQGSYQNGYKQYGSQIRKNGVYTGSFQKGLRSGNGQFKWNNGEVYKGNWKNGLKNGFGTWTSPNGDLYQGNWFQNMQHGEGMFKHSNSTYKGEFKQFLKDGKGIEVFVNGDKYDGQYKNGKPCGKGRYEWKQGQYYQGQFHEGLRQGNGKLADANGSVYQGQFKNDFKHGRGREIYITGERYEGQFSQGNRTKGKIYNKNSKCIQVIGQ